MNDIKKKLVSISAPKIFSAPKVNWFATIISQELPLCKKKDYSYMNRLPYRFVLLNRSVNTRGMIIMVHVGGMNTETEGI